MRGRACLWRGTVAMREVLFRSLEGASRLRMLARVARRAMRAAIARDLNQTITPDIYLRSSSPVPCRCPWPIQNIRQLDHELIQCSTAH